MTLRFAAAALVAALALSGCPRAPVDGGVVKGKKATTVHADTRSDKDKSDDDLFREAMTTTDMKIRAEKLELVLSHREDPEEIVTLRRTLLLTYAELGNIEKIEALAELVPIEEDKDGCETRNAIAYTYAEKGVKLDVARALVMKALSTLDRLESDEELGPRDDPEQMRGYFLDTLGWIDHKSGRNREAAAVLEEAARRLDHATIRWHLGEAYRALDDFENAGKAYARAATLEGADAMRSKESLEALGRDGKVDAKALLEGARGVRNQELEKQNLERAKLLLRNRVENKAPEFSMTDFAGAKLDNGRLRSTVTVLDFWASWCAPCKEELPVYQALYEKYKGRVNFLAVSVDRYKEEAEAFMKDESFSFPVAHDTNTAVAQKFEIEGIPTIVVIGPCGRINWVHQGYKQNIETILTAQINALLDETNASCDLPPAKSPEPEPTKAPAP